VSSESPLAGRHALVTGAASDIGGAVCRELSRLGAAVIASDLPGGRLDALASELEVRPADLTVPDEVSAVAVDAIDVVASVAGLVHVERFIDSDPSMWDALWQVNLRAPMLLTRVVAPGMVQRGWGRLVYVSSDSARAGAGGEAAYAATKAGLLGFAKSIAREVAVAGVTANVVCPGVIDTERSRSILGERGGMRDALLRSIPARQLGRPEDVAAAIGYLCSPQAAYVTGQVLSVNGGITMA
jgi:2-hydroxycyclohexanecarboxyl-CoA dehydrogenase